ncbi:MAG: hypothetical protein H7Z41_13055, partial [Cytophagales bacterium]|nr:hypothetical protein [Armatimonadota bacterium]
MNLLSLKRSGAPLAAAFSLAAFVSGGVSPASAFSQPPADAPPVAPAPPPARQNAAPRFNILNETLKALELTPEQRTKIQEIRAEYRKNGEAITAPRSPEGQVKVRELNQKLMADVKASLPSDQQTKFQAAFEEATAKAKVQNEARDVAAGLEAFRRPLAALNLSPEVLTKTDPFTQSAFDQIVATRKDRSLKRAERNAKQDTIIAEMKSKVRPLLTPAQQTQFDTLTFRPTPAQGRNRRPVAPVAPAAPPAEGAAP